MSAGNGMQCRLDCILLESEVSWTRKGPEGFIADMLQSENARLNEELSRTYPNLWLLSKALACARCDHYCDGAGFGLASSPIGERIGFAYHPWFLAQKSIPLRRTALILAMFGESRSRRGGYFRKDIEWMTGGRSKANTDRIINELCVLGVLRRRRRPGKQPRYRFLGFENTRTLEKTVDRLAIQEIARDLRAGLKEAELCSSRGCELWHPPYRVVGPTPPEGVDLFLAVMADLTALVYRSMFEPTESLRTACNQRAKALLDSLPSQPLSCWAELERYLWKMAEEDRTFLILLNLECLSSSVGLLPKGTLSPEDISSLGRRAPPRCLLREASSR